MKWTLSLGIALISASLTSTVFASPITVTDTYIGSKQHSHGDVIGLDSQFDIQSATITQTGSQFTFDIATNFAQKSGQLFNAYTVGGTGIGYGDLFLTSEWTPFGSAPFTQDDATTGTQWTYGLVLSDRYNNNGGTVSLFALTGSNTQTALMSDDLMQGNAQWRDGQEVIVDTASAQTQWLGDVGTWAVSNALLSISADLSLSSLTSASTMAFHWGMTCANDVIEGMIDLVMVPEPSTFALLLVGLIGLGAVRRRMHQA
ncbi:PEP-CTERM sorting domain-containing protein [Salinispirillum marinum]|uniref:PEP-CTERM sorting domain-containing protein n=2 Tax=Saccharospirillaceae TaxID=255527 RepID=A0ABV8BEA4_9GAMM